MRCTRVAQRVPRRLPFFGKNFVPADGMTTEFVPVAIGWYGEFGPSFQGFMERVGSYFGDRSGSEKEMQFAAKWRTRRLLLPAFVVTCVCCYLCLLLPVSLLPACFVTCFVVTCVCCYLRVVVTCVFCYLFRCYLLCCYVRTIPISFARVPHANGTRPHYSHSCIQRCGTPRSPF